MSCNNLMRSRLTIRLAAALLLSFATAGPVQAADREKIDKRVNEAVREFRTETEIGAQLMDQAEGVLVFPRVIKAAVGLGGAYGEGALLIGGAPVEYYRIAAGSFGFQLGAQATSHFVLFMTEKALKEFRGSEGWEIGADANVTLVDVGKSGKIDTEVGKNPVIGFVIGNKGLLAGVSLEGSKVSPIGP